MADERSAVEVLMDIADTLHAILDLSIKRTPKAKGTAITVAPDSVLDGKFGNPVIRAKAPRDWTGEDQIGKTLSECPPDYLSMCAERLDYFAQRAEENNEKAKDGKPKADYNRRDAAIYRGWSARLRSGWKPPQSSLPVDAPTDGWIEPSDPW